MSTGIGNPRRVASKAPFLKPGPVYTKVMNMTLDAKLDGIVKSREQEMEFVKELLKKLL